MKKENGNKGRVLVAMSGGVDSSLSAILLKKQGYEVVGVTLKLVEGSRCCDLEAVNHAKKVYKRYGIEHRVIDVSLAFKKKVIKYYLDDLKKGRTPNPCVICNRFLKFEELFKIAKKLKAKYVATGHYAKIGYNEKSGVYELFQGKDKVKDQSYYLSFLKQDWLSKIIFPIGNSTKDEVYKMAKKEKLDFLVEKKQSQDLCFVDNKLKKNFVESTIGKKLGDIVDENGKVLSRHNGIHYYTIGQRKGLLLSGGPYFVTGFNFEKNQVIVSKNAHEKSLYQTVVNLRNVNFISEIPKNGSLVSAKIRYQQKLSKAYLKRSEKSSKKGEFYLKFKTPQRAVTSGQVAVFYQGKKCLGGGIIK